MLTVAGQAKLNLTLEVLKKREDGYHEIRSLVQTIDFCDKLRFQAGQGLEITCDLPEWSAGKSLVTRAANLLRSTTGSSEGATIEIEKRIPLSSGLGGDSSDAAAVLRGLNLLWNLKLSLRDLINFAAQLGSDVALFLYGGTLLMEGRGEKIKPVRPMPHMSVVILMPKVIKPENKTAKLYAQLTPASFTNGKTTDNLIKILESRENNPESGLFNVFDSVGLRYFSGLKEIKNQFLECGAPEVHLAGSGPTLFSLVRDSAEANNIYKRLLEKGLEAYLADF
jgi:4-diphosphocytidyl-2-C-methyl-D-erythritol kinase